MENESTQALNLAVVITASPTSYQVSLNPEWKAQEFPGVRDVCLFLAALNPSLLDKVVYRNVMEDNEKTLKEACARLYRLRHHHLSKSLSEVYKVAGQPDDVVNTVVARYLDQEEKSIPWTGAQGREENLAAFHRDLPDLVRFHFGGYAGYRDGKQVSVARTAADLEDAIAGKYSFDEVALYGIPHIKERTRPRGPAPRPFW